jgi:hypothetical protein
VSELGGVANSQIMAWSLKQKSNVLDKKLSHPWSTKWRKWRLIKDDWKQYGLEAEEEKSGFHDLFF